MNFPPGSSPWVRGTHDLAPILQTTARFIPVGTGNTSTLHHISSINAVHPRGYGEHKKNEVSVKTYNGSSPWVRGTPAPNEAVVGLLRFIPVGTGNTRGHQSPLVGHPVHPRGYGEH